MHSVCLGRVCVCVCVWRGAARAARSNTKETYLLYSTGNSAQCYVAAWMGGAFGGERIHVYVGLSLFAVHLRLSQVVNWLYSYIK